MALSRSAKPGTAASNAFARQLVHRLVADVVEVAAVGLEEPRGVLVVVELAARWVDVVIGPPR
jgi:hypothetical protein